MELECSNNFTYLESKIPMNGKIGKELPNRVAKEEVGNNVELIIF